ncbi:hypothetical protein [Streptomyces sp. NPDC047043]|uniref:hypothetical protein n=1 Tax=Streptomyces sp. NPDC047043 TaxID=3154497 RepID=UPI0033F0B19D
MSRSRTNTLALPLVSPGARFEAYESKATRRPSALIDGPVDSRFAGPPPRATDAFSRAPLSMSRT